MDNEDTSEGAVPAGRWSARPPRSTPELIVELQARATALTLAAIAVVNGDVTQFVFATDEEPLDKLNALIGGGGHPIGVVGARIDNGTVEYHARPFVEYGHRPDALAYLQRLRTLFLTLMRTHMDRMPDNPRLN